MLKVDAGADLLDAVEQLRHLELEGTERHQLLTLRESFSKLATRLRLTYGPDALKDQFVQGFRV